jgi:hypothetical protein
VLINGLGLLLATLLAMPVVRAQPAQINVSEDLVRLGIAARNAVPGNPNADARPLFQAAIQYAAANGVSRIIADYGSYWFLTPQQAGIYLYLNQVSDVTIDLQGSDIYLNSSFVTGIYLKSCQGVTLTNFTIDYVQLPFTQVQLTGVNPTNATLSYQTISGWPSPVNLPTPDSSGAYWGIVLREGSPIANAGRLPLSQPTSSNTLQVVPGTMPWTQPSVLSTYQPGDVIVVTLRDGQSTIEVDGGDSVLVTGVDIYSSGTLGLQMNATTDSTVTNVRVMPRPGTDRLISTNADGIQLSYIQANNQVLNCYIDRTMDDGISLNSPFLAFVSSVTGSRSMVVARNFQTQVPNGTAVSLLNPNTGQTVGRYILVSQNPPFTSSNNISQSATYTFDQQLPTVQSGFGLVFADSVNRGLSSVIANNVVEDVLFARGIFLGGVTGVTVQQNTVSRTNCGGIVLHHDLAAYPTAANQDILVLSNTVDQAIGPAAVGTGAIAALGSIFVLATDANFIPLTTPTETNIIIANNSISNSGRSALWIGNMDYGIVEGNTINGFDLYPQLALWGISQTLANQLTVDFTQAVAAHTDLNAYIQQN